MIRFIFSRLNLCVLLSALLLLTSCFDPGKQITFIHHNDFHAANSPYQHYIDGQKVTIQGVAGLKGLANAVRDTCAPSLWLFAGDEYTGGPICSITKGASQIPLCQELKFDVAVIGNHEFDYGLDRARAYVDSLGCPVLGGANLLTPDDKPFALTHIDTIVGTVAMRIIGLVPPDLHSLTGDDVTGDLKVINLAEAVREHLPKSERLMTVILSHIGLNNDIKLAQEVQEIDVIVGGHQHAIVHQPKIVSESGVLEGNDIYGDGKKRVPGVIVVQAGGKGVFLGVLSMTVKYGDVVAVSGQLLPNDGSLAEPDEKVANIVKGMEQTLAKSMDHVIAHVKDDLTRNAWGIESTLGRWETDIFREHTKAEIAFQNVGGLRKDILAGELKIRDIWEANPFGNTLVLFDISGSELKKALNHIVSGDHEPLISSGLSVTVDKKNKMIRNDLEVGGKPAQDNEIYRAVTNSYVFGHFKDYFGIDKGNRYSYDTGYIDRDAIIEHARKVGEIEAPEDVRLKIVNY